MCDFYGPAAAAFPLPDDDDTPIIASFKKTFCKSGLTSADFVVDPFAFNSINAWYQAIIRDDVSASKKETTRKNNLTTANVVAEHKTTNTGENTKASDIGLFYETVEQYPEQDQGRVQVP